MVKASNDKEYFVEMMRQMQARRQYEYDDGLNNFEKDA